MIAANPVDGIAKVKRVFRELARRRARLSDTQQRASGARVPEASDVKIEKFDLRDAVVCAACRSGLVKCEAREIEPRLIQQGRCDRARPTQRSHIIIRLQSDILDGTVPAV